MGGRQAEVQKEAGAQGLKIWKPFGLHVKDHQGQLVKVDDVRLKSHLGNRGGIGLAGPDPCRGPGCVLRPDRRDQ